MIRPRPGDFVYSTDELRVMARDVEAVPPHRPDGFVFGVLAADGRIDAACGRRVWWRWAGGLPCVFHRAFDRVPEAGEALEQLIALGFAPRADQRPGGDRPGRAAEIAKLVKRAAGRIEVLPCGRVRAEDARRSGPRLTGCDQVHGSFARPLQLPDERGRRGYPERSATSRDEVAATRAAARPTGRYPVGLASLDRLGVVADDLPFDEVDHVLGDVRGVVGDPLQVADGREQRQPRLDPVRGGLHLGDQLGDDRRRCPGPPRRPAGSPPGRRPGPG